VNKKLFAAAALMFVPLAIPSAPSADASASGPRHSDIPGTGLAVTMDQITPAYLQPGKPVRVSGTVTNLDQKLWKDVQVYLLAPNAPATSTRQLNAVANSEADAYAGNRITRDGLFPQLGRIAPGETVPYTLNIPFSQLNIPSNQYGVYTLSVQALGAKPSGQRATAGRARSFIPLMPPHSPSIGVATIFPFRSEIMRRPDGGYLNRDQLIQDISPGGRLRRMLDLARTAGSTPISILVDPALLDALERIAENNTERPGTPVPASESPSPTDETSPEDIAPLTEEERTARDFLMSFQRLASEHPLWTEGYGGPDLTTLAGDYDGTRMFRTLTRATVATMGSLDLTHAERAYVPTGALDVQALDGIGKKTAIFVSSDQVRGWQPSDGPVGIVRSHGSRARVVVTHDDLLDGSPEPGPTDTALQVRQRLLAESALLSLGADPDSQGSTPSIAMLADDNWGPADALRSNFFAAFGAPWVRASTLDTERAAGPLPGAEHLRAAHFDEGQVDPPLPNSLAHSADQIRGRGVIMYAITGDDRRILNFYDQSASLTVSEQWRQSPDVSQGIADQMIDQLDNQIGRVHIEAPEFVTLSSSSGRFPLTITNNLDWPIRVGIRLKANDAIKIKQDEPIEVEPRQSTTVNVQVHAEDVGVTEVTARLTTPKGRPFGEPVTFKMRSSVVGTVIWIALGAAGAIIVLAVGRRVRRSAKSKKQQPGVASEPTAGDPG